MLRFLVLLLALLTLSLPTWARDMSPYNQGRDQGAKAGRREGRERGRCDGRLDGREDGFQQGLIDGQQLQLDAAWAEGFQQGEIQGQSHGQTAGREAGQQLGREEGRIEGERRGHKIADETALKNVLSQAQADGLQRARSATPVPDGRRDGAKFGQEQAAAEARKVDFARGREQYRQQQLQSQHAPEIQLRQAPISHRYSTWTRLGQESSVTFGKRPIPACDYRYCSYGSDNPDFRKGYRRGYRSGFRSSYRSQYQWGYDSAFRSGVRRGIRSSPIVDTQAQAQSAFQKGYEKAKLKAFETSQAEARRAAYTPAFKVAYEQSFQKHYPEFYLLHHEKEEERAFQRVYQTRYKPAFEEARSESYQRHYPKLAKAEFLQGREAEKADFQVRPVRLQGSWLTKTDRSGLYLVSVQFRNFSNKTIPGHRVRVHLNGESSRLFHELPARSLVTVTGVFRLKTRPPSPPTLSASLKNGERELSLGQAAVVGER